MYLSKLISALALCLLFVACDGLPQTPNLNSKSNSNANVQPTPQPSPAVRIIYPVEGDRVEQTGEEVKGTSQNIPSEKNIWVVIFIPKVGRYYPQNNPIELQPNGNWASPTTFGVAGNKGLKFDVLAVTVDKDARASFDEYLRRAKDRNDYPGWEQLPKGTTIYDRVTVIRK